MKKILLGAAMMISFLNFSFAQTATTAKAVRQTSHKTVVAQSPTGAHAKTEIKSETKTAETKTIANDKGVMLKKDGTPDKRYKATEVTTTKLKKDGTADKRYKANKKM